MLWGLTGFDRSGFGYLCSGNLGGDGGGDGVEVVERNVGPGGVENMGRIGDSCSRGTAITLVCDNGHGYNRNGRG